MNLRVVAISGTVALLTSLLLARAHPFGDAGLYAPASRSQAASMPPKVATILFSKCGDCHSNEPHSPIYGRFAPVSWLMERDIVGGRKQFNLSLWDSYSPEKQQLLQAKMIQQTKSGSMPLPQYRAIHWHSGVTEADMHVLLEWATSVTPTDGPPTSSEGNSAAGRIVFEKRCTGCHSLEQNREGPVLRGIFGRPAGHVPNFVYSAALQGSHITWNELTLDEWLTDPDAFVSGNNMEFRVVKAQERSDLIQFLKESAVQ